MCEECEKLKAGIKELEKALSNVDGYITTRWKQAEARIKELEQNLDREITYKNALEQAEARIKELEEGIERWINSDWEGDDDVTYFKKLIEKEKPCQP